MKFEIKPFNQLALTELYQILQLRNEVFVVEQNCPYQDIDGQDITAEHILLLDGEQLQGCTRIIAPQHYDRKHSSIGRIVLSRSARGKHWGEDLVKFSIAQTRQRFPDCDILISAQSALNDFYCSLGFVCTGEFYLEDGIPHQKMRFTAN